MKFEINIDKNNVLFCLFCRELAVGRGSTAPLKNSKLPSVDGIEAWDGKDGELPEEEEYDLSDIDLDDLDDIKQELWRTSSIYRKNNSHHPTFVYSLLIMSRSNVRF